MKPSNRFTNPIPSSAPTRSESVKTRVAHGLNAFSQTLRTAGVVTASALSLSLFLYLTNTHAHTQLNDKTRDATLHLLNASSSKHHFIHCKKTCTTRIDHLKFSSIMRETQFACTINSLIRRTTHAFAVMLDA